MQQVETPELNYCSGLNRLAWLAVSAVEVFLVGHLAAFWDWEMLIATIPAYMIRQYAPKRPSKNALFMTFLRKLYLHPLRKQTANNI